MLSAGTVRAGGSVDYLAYAGAPVPILELLRDLDVGGCDETTVGRYLAAPIHHKLRRELEARDHA